MTQETATFNVSDFELRNYTQPWLTPAQQEEVTDAEDRVNSQLDFLAQMLGWNGPNYWGNLPATPDQKRQLLAGTFGVYRSYIIPRVYEVRNWDNTLLIDRLQFINPDITTQVVRISVGEETYTLQSVQTEGDKYVIGMGELSQEFYDNIAANVPIKVDIPTYRPAPFYRPEVGVSGDASFTCHKVDGALSLSPGYDQQGNLTYKFPCLIAGSTYYFNQPVYFSDKETLEPLLTPRYDADLSLWVLQIPPTGTEESVGITGYLAWAHSGATETANLSLQVVIKNWVDPSDWGNENVLDNFTGAWGNKGGPLPFNLAFDALSIHGFDERNSVHLPDFTADLNFDDIVNFIYYQKVATSTLAPPNPSEGDIWWNDATGALSVWLLGGSGCGSWLEIDYRGSLRQTLPPQTTYPDVPSFRAGSGSLAVGTVVRIDDVSGLDISDNVIGVQGTLTSPGRMVLHRDNESAYWTADEIWYANVSSFEEDAVLLPFKVPVTILNSQGLSPDGNGYTIRNLGITVNGEYETLLVKHYTNTTWEIYPDSLLKYIAFSSLFTSPVEGEMWWDFSDSNPNSRAASIYYGPNQWVQVNQQGATAAPPNSFSMGAIRFYCNDNILDPDVPLITDDFIFSYSQDPLTGKYTVKYVPRNFVGKAQTPTVTISDSLTTTYRSDITSLVFSGITHYMSPNVLDAETPLRLWKSEALQVVETEAHITEGNYVNPLLADVNSGPGDENWQRYFVRLPLDYGRNEDVWGKVTLICQDFAYWGSRVDPEEMRCPPEDDTPAVWEELFLYDQPVNDYTYVYYEGYLYSTVAYFSSPEPGDYLNSGVYPASDVQFDEFSEASLKDFDPLHSRQADVTSPVGQGYGDWLGMYVNINPCVPLTGYVETDLLSGAVTPVKPPVWDASIYKYPPTCESEAASFNVDANNYKVGYAYFVADASAAEDAFFDISQEAAWRYPVNQPKTLYVTPR